MPQSARWWASILLLTCGCGGQPPDPPQPAAEVDPVSIPGTMVGSTWPVSMADDQARAPFESHPGWAMLVMQRDYPGALEAFSADPALATGQARLHIELAAAYRQAAILGARATEQVYGNNRREEDPPEVDCLLGFGRVLLDQGGEATPLLRSCSAAGYGALSEHAASWLAWLESGAAWPPEAPLADMPGLPAQLAPGELPELGGLPHYTLTDLVEGLAVQAGNPTVLLGMALLHQGAAYAALPGSERQVDTLMAPWSLPIEPAGFYEVELPPGLLFGSPLLLGADASFLADVARDQGVAAVGAWKDRSPHAAAIAPCVDSAAGTVDVACVLERADRSFDQLRGAMEIHSGGEAGFHRPFAELGRLGVVRCAEAVAAAAGDHEAMGLLRLNALDFSTGSSAEPAYLLSIAGWDAGNRNTSRATETLHAQVGHIPGVEVARFPLDALHVRLSRESAPGVPMH